LTFFEKMTKITSLKIIRKGADMAFIPLANRVLVEREEQTNTTASGIIIPDTAKKKPLQGKVIAVGPEAKEDGISEGDTVVFADFSGMEITIEEKEYLILLSKEVLGLIQS
jgi:chaperonin GroES